MKRKRLAILIVLGANVPLGYSKEPGPETNASEIHQLDEISVEAVSPSSRGKASFFNKSIKRTKHNGPKADDIDAVTQRVSNVAVERSSVQTRVVIRGMTSINGGLRDPVGYVVDDVALPLGVTQAPDWMNTGNIDIVTGSKGKPQGRHAHAGSVLVTSEFPSLDNTAWGNYSLLFADGGRKYEPTNTVTGGVSGPVSEKQSLSLALRYENSESPFYNLADSNRQNRRNSTSFSGGWSYFPNKNTDIQLRSHWESSRGGRAFMRYVDGPFATRRFVVNHDTETNDDKKSAIHSLRVDHSFDNIELVSVTGVTQYQRDFTMDLDSGPMMTPATVSSLRDRMVSQEFRITSTEPDSQLNWSVGSYLYGEDTDSDFTIGTAPTKRETQIDQLGAALFGDIEYSFSNGLTLVPGIRVEKIRKEGDQEVSGALSGQYNDVQYYTAFLPKLSAIYELSADTIIYAALSKGYQPGGYNHTSATNTQAFVYGSEDSYTVELGFHDSYWNRRINGQLVLFGTLVKNKQVVDLLPGNARQVSNAGEAEIFGLEYSFDAEITNDISLNGVLGWQEAELTDFKTRQSRNGEDRSGNDLPYSPHFTASVNLNYQFSPSWQMSVSTRHTDSFYFDSQNNLEQPGYLTVDVEARYSRGGAFVTLSANNILEREVFSRAVRTPSGTVVEDAQPRSISLLIGYRI